MKKLTTVLVLIMALFCGQTQGCALINQQLQSIEDMSTEEFDNLAMKAFHVARLGGERLRPKFEEAEANYLDALVRTLISKDNSERAKILAKLLKDEKYQNTLALAIGAALDAIEAAVGKPLDLESINLTARQHKLIRNMLEGFLLGFSGSDFIHIS